MVVTLHFDPFNNRLCRDVRNALAVGFIDALNQRVLAPVRRAVDGLLEQSLPAYVADYIRRRWEAYNGIFTDVTGRDLKDPLDIAFCIWDRHLFFETHEFLEPYWMRAVGEEKKLLQALIRAAGTYVHLEQGNLKSADRIALKAIQGLQPHRARLAVHTDPDLLLDKLRRLDPLPPKLSSH